jgi:hypothetical protein
MAYFHHYIVRFRAYSVGIKNFKDYLILGDDIVIANEKVKDKYLSIIRDLGVSISIQKSVFPREDHSSCEFASQYLTKEGNISPLPVGTIFEGTNESLFAL